MNAIVLSWLLNSVSKSLLRGVSFASLARAMRNDLKERFDQLDRSRFFSLHKEITTLQQGTYFVSVYFTKLKTLWDEFETLVPSPGCNCEQSKGFVNYQKLYQFLLGLNESFSQDRSQILLMVSIPTINQAYAMMVNDECQKVSSSRSSIGLNSMGTLEWILWQCTQELVEELALKELTSSKEIFQWCVIFVGARDTLRINLTR